MMEQGQFSQTHPFQWPLKQSFTSSMTILESIIDELLLIYILGNRNGQNMTGSNMQGAVDKHADFVFVKVNQNNYKY